MKYYAIIVGSGFGGITAANMLERNGITDYLMLEKYSEMGGTWWANAYPGAQVDVQSYLYSLSFAPYNWSRVFARRDELLAYTRHVIDKLGLRAKCRTNTRITEAAFQDNSQTWLVKTEGGETFECNVVLNASGPLDIPSIPDFEGKDKFKGVSCHTARWAKDFDYTGKRVAIIGTGASAVQVIPAMAEKAAQLHVFQRTPHWVIPRPDRALSGFEKAMYAKSPFMGRLYRNLIYWMLESRLIGFVYAPSLMKLKQKQATAFRKRIIKDPEMLKKLTPDFTLGCKRVLLSNEYYPALIRDNVSLETEGFAEINETGIYTYDRRQIDVDMIVYATGFKASEGNYPFDVYGRNGVSLKETWTNEGMHAYLGTTIPGFPNFFFMLGPNTGIGHTSAIHIIESQAMYAERAIRAMRSGNLKSIEIKADVEKAYNEMIQRKLQKTVWNSGGCKSWYLNSKGINTTLMPAPSFALRRWCKRFRIGDHIAV